MTGAARQLVAISNTADRLLSHLDGVEKHGGGWRARCPSHGSDRNRALSVAVGDDGRVLAHCHAGCSVLEIVHAVGLELADLFPERITHHSTPDQRRELRQSAKQAQWAAALDVLEFEARIIAVAGDQIAQGEPLNTGDRTRLGLALQRVEDARKVLRGR
jgi:hypothetical protein